MNSFSKIYDHLSKNVDLDLFWRKYMIIALNSDYSGWAFSFSEPIIKFKPTYSDGYIDYEISERLLLKLVKIL